MSNSKWYKFKLWLCQFVEGLLPDGVRRQALYTLGDRALVGKQNGDPWVLTYLEMYDTLKD